MALIIDPSTRRFTRADLVSEARERFEFTEGTFRKWQEFGLIATPSRVDRWTPGKPGSAKALWSDHDRQMLLALLDLRSRFRQESSSQLSLGPLANVVVWSWVYWDDVIRLDQAKSALRTSLAPQVGGAQGRARSRRRLREILQRYVEALAAPDASSEILRKWLDQLADLLWAGSVERLGDLAPDLERIIDPHGVGRRVGAPGASIDAAGEIERLIAIHDGARAILTGDSTPDDRHWETARGKMRTAWASYRVEWQALASMSTNPEMFGEPTFQRQFDHASSTLVMVIGYQLRATRDQTRP